MSAVPFADYSATDDDNGPDEPWAFNVSSFVVGFFAGLAVAAWVYAMHRAGTGSLL